MTSAPGQLADPATFRSQFPVFERHSYLNAGTEGPIPRRAAEAAHRRLDEEASEGRSGKQYMEAVVALAQRLRERYAEVLGCAAGDVALTGSTTDGVNTVLSGLDLRAGDEILTTDEEHPGLLAPLGRARRRHGVSVRVVPFDEIACEVTPSTRLIACSHVSWVSGRLIDAHALAATGVPVLLDAAQALGAVPVDVHALGCDFYAASGQKWLCGPEGSGCLFVREDRLEELVVPWPGYGSVADPELALDFTPAAGAARLDHGFPVGMRSAWAISSLELFAEVGWEWVHGRAASLASWLAVQLNDRGFEIRGRGPTTLVSWSVDDPQAEVARMAAAGFIIRSIPERGLARASVGAWSSEEELETFVRLAAR